MIRTLIAAGSMTALAGLAIAQPPGRAPDAGFGIFALDANADGKVERSELVASQKARFDVIDTNRDGQAQPEEFKAFHEQARAAHAQEAAASRFAALDKDGSGQISQAEFSAAMQERGDRTGGRRGPGRDISMSGPAGGPGKGGRGPDAVKERGVRGDVDADGKVSFTEFSARALAAFDRADTNKDGVVTISELQASRPGRP